MSSIPQQEPIKPSSKSPIPRSRSDFSYVGLTPKEKRWTTDFSLLLPPFSRDTSGYSRLTESPVTLQPKPRSVTKLIKSPTMDSAVLSQKRTSMPDAVMSRSPTLDPYISKDKYNRMESKPHRSPTLETCIGKSHPVCHFKSSARIKYPQASCLNLEPNRCLRHEVMIRRSPTLDSKILNPTRTVMTYISRSPTLDPNVLSRCPRDCTRHSNSPFGTRSPLANRVEMNPSDVVRSQSMRSLQKSMDKSPSRVRNSESAQSDVASSYHRPYPLMEADEFDEDDIRRLRNFTVTSKGGLINWGDSFRSHSLTSVPTLDYAPSCSNSQWDVASTKSYPMTTSSSHWNCNRKSQRYKVAIMGADEVGKTSLIRQFQTSEYICAFDTSYDINKEYAITVILNKEESELEFIECRSPDEENDEKDENVRDEAETRSTAGSLPYADSHVIVYSVTNRRSFLRALNLLSKVQRMYKRSAVLLVGNKSDLVRVRAVTTDDGQAAAKERNSTFIETSAAINHQVDELLVSILTQIRAKSKSYADCSTTTRWSHSHYSLSRAKGIIKKFLKKACFQSKSSDNLQRL